MADQVAKGDEFETKAEKALNGWGLFGSKYEDAADLYDKAANCYKLGKSWRQAGFAYKKLASCHLKLENKHEAASAYVDAARMYKKISSEDTAFCLNEAVNLFLEYGRLTMAAKYYKELGEIYEQDQDFERALGYFEQAADLYQSEESSSPANDCKKKIAQCAIQLEQYPKAVEIFEAIARQNLNNNLLKYGVKDLFLNAGLCQLCRGDVVAISNSLERYQDLDPTFSGSREYKFLSDLAAAMEKEDVEQFTDIVREFDSMTRLDPLKTTLLLKAKNALKERENEEDDLT